MPGEKARAKLEPIPSHAGREARAKLEPVPSKRCHALLPCLGFSRRRERVRVRMDVHGSVSARRLTTVNRSQDSGTSQRPAQRARKTGSAAIITFFFKNQIVNFQLQPRLRGMDARCRVYAAGMSNPIADNKSLVPVPVLTTPGMLLWEARCVQDWLRPQALSEGA